MDVIIDKIHQLTAHIRAFELISTQGDSLPAFSAGAHIDVHLKTASLANTHFQTVAVKDIVT